MVGACGGAFRLRAIILARARKTKHERYSVGERALHSPMPQKQLSVPHYLSHSPFPRIHSHSARHGAGGGDASCAGRGDACAGCVDACAGLGNRHAVSDLVPTS
uniref:Uncharacterized protein n=1 Tax=Chrysotila carterae TaxID=13221 RepID=A0A7S4BH29_CHRCT